MNASHCLACARYVTLLSRWKKESEIENPASERNNLVQYRFWQHRRFFVVRWFSKANPSGTATNSLPLKPINTAVWPIAFGLIRFLCAGESAQNQHRRSSPQDTLCCRVSPITAFDAQPRRRCRGRFRPVDRLLRHAVACSHGVVLNRRLHLRKQLSLYVERDVRPRRATDSIRFTLARPFRWFDWRETLIVVKPDTLIRWHRKGFRLFWKWKSRPRGRPSVPTQVRTLIAEMATNNPTWGEERIADELLLKTGIQIGRAHV